MKRTLPIASHPAAFASTLPPISDNVMTIPSDIGTFMTVLLFPGLVHALEEAISIAGGISLAVHWNRQTVALDKAVGRRILFCRPDGRTAGPRRNADPASGRAASRGRRGFAGECP